MRKKVLIVSANPLDRNQNNGKTLLSFFSGYGREYLAQLYFYPTLPNTTEFERFFRISDFDVLNRRLHRSKTAGGPVEPVESALSVSTEETVRMGRIKKSALTCLAREVLWHGAWRSEALDRWLDETAPDVIFFVAGDGLYSYDICEYARRRTGAKLVVYTGDDYVLPRPKFYLAQDLRRRLILRKLKSCVDAADLFLTISEPMRRTYRELLGKDSLLAANMADSLREAQPAPKTRSGLLLVYLGGFQYHRDATLHRLAEAIARINGEGRTPLFLEIYSNAQPDDALLRQLEVPGASAFCGCLDQAGVKWKVNEADILVHVESFSPESIADVRLSLSTKIPEYLSTGKPLLAIGPAEVASMVYLRDKACCVTDEADLEPQLRRLAEDAALRSSLGAVGRSAYEKNHRRDVCQAALWDALDRL